MKKLVKHIVGATWRPLLVKYLSTTRNYRYKDICLSVPPSVFHPGLFFSTLLLLKELKKNSLHAKKFLEPGAGSGLLSIYAARQGALVTATDINPVAIKCLNENGNRNKVSLQVIQSDVLDSVPHQTFDLIAINPPYYKKSPRSYSDYAWNCGENGEYFEKLFSRLEKYLHPDTKTLLVLCDGCDIGMVKSIASKNGFVMRTIATRKNLLEKNFVYSIEAKPA